MIVKLLLRIDGEVVCFMGPHIIKFTSNIVLLRGNKLNIQLRNVYFTMFTIHEKSVMDIIHICLSLFSFKKKKQEIFSENNFCRLVFIRFRSTNAII